MSIDYVMDRFAIQDTLIRFSTAIDTKQLDLLDQVFTADAHIDYGQYWGPGDRKSFKQWASVSLKNYSGWQHLLTNMVIEIDGDAANTTTDFYNPIIGGEAGAENILHAYGWYHDQLTRTSQGWLISQRKMQPLLGLNPESMK